MAAKKKTWRITVAMQCKDCGTTGYFTSINKSKNAKIELKKYCKKDQKRTVHASREKLK